MNSKIFSKSPILGLVICIPLLLLSCINNDSPQPIKSGTDRCSGCQMTIVEPKFACEIITTKGKKIPFDDLSCLFHYIGKKRIAEQEVSRIFVANFLQPDSLIDIKKAYLVLGYDIKTPMHGGVAAFSDKTRAIQMAQETKSTLLDSWERLKMQH